MKSLTILIVYYLIPAWFWLGEHQVSQSGGQFRGRCLKVYDGDTILVDSRQGPKRIRMLYIDAPELRQTDIFGRPWGEISKEYLERKISGKLVDVLTRGKGHYGRVLGEVYLNKTNINLQMVAQGMAVIPNLFYFKDKKVIPSYLTAITIARINKKGFWQTRGLLRPDLYRKASSH